MTEIIEGNSVNMKELSKRNKLSEFENFKLIFGFLQQKVDFYGEPEKIKLVCKGNEIQEISGG